MFGKCIDRINEGKHFDFVELVNTDNSSGVFAIRSGFAAKTRRERRIAQRKLLGVKDFVAVIRRQGNFSGAHEVEVVAFHAVDVFCGLTQETRAFHGCRFHQNGWHHQGESSIHRQIHRHVD